MLASPSQCLTPPCHTPPRRLLDRRLLSFSACFVVVAMFAGGGLAQTKQVMSLKNTTGADVDLSAVSPRDMQIMAPTLLQFVPSGRAGTPQQMEVFDKFHLVKLAEMTWPTKDSMEQKRLDLKRKYLKQQFLSANSPELHDRLNQLFLANLPALVADAELSLQARYNYLLLLGQLDKLEYDISKSQAAVPLPEVTPLLVAEANKPDNLETLRITAWIGLARQAELQLTAQARTTIATETQKIIAAKQPLPGYSVDGHHWLRKLALQALTGLAKTAGGDVNRPETVKALYDILVDVNEPMFIRRDAVFALGHLDPNVFASGTIRAPEVLKALGNFTLQITQAGSPNDRAAPPSMANPADVFPPPNEENKKAFADGVAYYLNCVATALGGRSTRGLKSVPGLDPKTAGLINQLLTKHIDPLVIALGNPRLNLSQLPADLEKTRGELGAWLQSNALDAVAGGGNAPPPGGP